MATEPFRFRGKVYGELTPEEAAAARKELNDALVGHQLLTQQLPTQEEGIFGGSAASAMGLPPPEVSPEQEALAQQGRTSVADIEQRMQALQQAQKQAEQSRIVERARTAFGQRPEGQQLAQPSAQPDSVTPPTFVGPTLEHVEPTVGQQYRNVITSRPGGPGEGKIVHETRRVPIGPGGAEQAADLAAARYAGAEDWKTRALAENPMRAARTEAFRGTPVSDTSPGFLVREGQGGFSPGRQIDQVLGERGITELTEAEIRRESPAMQDLLREAQQNEFQRQMQAGAVEDIGLRRRRAVAETGLAEEQLRRAQDPTIAAREQMALYNEVRGLLGPEKADAIETKFQAAIATLKQQFPQGVPSELERAVRQQITLQETGDPAIVARIQAIMTGDPRVAAAQARGIF